MKPLFIIPARGGSKGIPGKNIKPLCGKPLIGYSIEIAKELAPVEDICVTTDDPKIASVAAAEFGLSIPFLRPAELATDKSGSREVMLHAVDYYNSQLGKDYDTIVLLQPTSPFRTADDVRKCMELYTDRIDMVVTVMECKTNPYYNCFERGSNGYLKISKGDGKITRRQDAPKAWEMNGAVYVINVDSLKRMPIGEMTRRMMYEMPTERSVDLDTPLDWMIAEAIMKHKTV